MNKIIVVFYLFLSVVLFSNETVDDFPIDDFEILEDFDDDASFELEDTVILGESEDTHKESNKNTTTITAQEIKDKNYSTTGDILKEIPNIQVFGKSIDIRGQGVSSKNRVMILINGVPVKDMLIFEKSNIDTVSVDDIEEIEVIPGGSSVLYGNGAIGGVINIITKKKSTSLIETGFKAGSYSEIMPSFSISGSPIDNLDIRLSGDYRVSEGYRDSEKEDEKHINLWAGFSLNTKHKLEVKYGLYNSIKNQLTLQSLGELEENRQYSELLGDNNLLKNSVSFNYSGEINSSFNIKSNLYFVNKEVNYNMSELKAPLLPSFTSDPLLGLNSSGELFYGQSNRLVLGIELLKEDATVFAIPPFDDLAKLEHYFNKNSMDLFASNSLKIGKLEFTQGIRYSLANYSINIDPEMITRKINRVFTDHDEYIKTLEQLEKIINASDLEFHNMGEMMINLRDLEKTDINKTSNDFAFELGARYNYSDSGALYLRLDKAYFSPSPLQLLRRNVVAPGVFDANPDLKSEEHYTVELGLADTILSMPMYLYYF